MGSSKTRILFIILQLVYLVTTQEMVKRVPQGFMGMRGKKFTSPESGEFEQYFKRKPQFFVGVKGKKSLVNSLESDFFDYKRAPMGFVGMRGKKDTENNLLPSNSGSLIGTIDYATKEDLKNSDISLIETFLDQCLNNKFNNEIAHSSYKSKIVEEPDYVSYPEYLTREIEKKAANIHQFFGVRGKKSLQTKRPFDLTFRGKFIGVRGKKDLKSAANLQELRVLLDSPEPWPKRKSQMGFFGMRGKKWDDDSSSEATMIN